MILKGGHQWASFQHKNTAKTTNSSFASRDLTRARLVEKQLHQADVVASRLSCEDVKSARVRHKKLGGSQRRIEDCGLANMFPNTPYAG